MSKGKKNKRKGGNSKPPKSPTADLDQRLLGARIKLAEAVSDWADNFIDPRDAFIDDDTGERWRWIGVAPGGDTEVLPFLDEQALAVARAECRDLARRNEYAINGHENRISYVVGTGHKYTVIPKEGQEVAEEALVTAQAIIDQFILANNWNGRQQEIRRREDRDGEVFIRFFRDQEASPLVIRFVEPVEVSTPTGEAGNPAASFGILTDPTDVETVLGYWINGDFVEGPEIQHRKLGVDTNVKRGVPLMWPVRKNLRRAEKLLRNMTVVAEIQTAIAMIRKHVSGKASIEAMIENDADASIENRRTGRTDHFRQYRPGTILDAPGNIEYEFPSMGIDGARYVVILQAELRAIASRLVMPEFMLSSDASNANFASTMVAEGPATKFFQRLQWTMAEDDKKIMLLVLELGGTPEAIFANITIDVQPPRVTTRDRKAEIEANMMEVDRKVMSKETARIRDDLDPAGEKEKIEAQTEESMADNPFAGMMPGQQIGQSGDDDDDDPDNTGGDEDEV